jgi:hypothetical protein
MRMSNPKLHWKQIIASGPFDSNIRKGAYQTGCEVGVGPLAGQDFPDWK